MDAAAATPAVEELFDLSRDAALGEGLNRRLRKLTFFENEGWACERANRVSERLQFDAPASERLIVEVPWLEEKTAFTAPGRYIYFCRGLYERCGNDEEVAFVVAHEMAHHRLGHAQLLGSRIPFVAALPGAALIACLIRGMQRRAISPEAEIAADRLGLELCLRAGYDGWKCLRLFDILEELALDAGDLSGAFGCDWIASEPRQDQPLSRAARWIWERARGYPALRERKQRLREHLERLQEPAPSTAAGE